MIAISAGSRSNASIPPASIRATTPNGLTQLRRVDDPVRVAEAADQPALDVDLDDVAAMDALLDRRCGPGGRGSGGTSAAVAAGARTRVAPSVARRGRRRDDGRRWAGRSGALTVGRGYCGRVAAVAPWPQRRKAVGRTGRATTPWAPGRAIRPGTPDRDVTLRPPVSASTAAATRGMARAAGRSPGPARVRSARRADPSRPTDTPEAAVARRRPSTSRPPGRPPQARDPPRRADRAEEVPGGRPRAVVAARLRGAGRRAGPAADDPDADRGDGGGRARRPDRARPDPAGRPRDGRRDARADADRRGLASRACSATSGRCGRSSTTTSCPTRRRSTCA